VTNQQRGRTLAVYTMVTLFAGASGQYLILVGDLRSGLPFTLAAILFLLGLPPVTLTRMREPRGVAAVGLDLRRLHEVSPLAVAAVLASGFANSAFWGMGPVFAQRVGLGGGGTATLMSATILGGALVQWPVGHFSDRIDRRRVLISICFAGTAAALGGAALVDVSTPALVACAFLYGGATFTLYPLSLAHANDHAASRDVLETTRGLLMLYGLSAVFGPVAAGTLMGAFGPRSLFLCFAATQAFVALYGLYRIRQRQSVAAEEREEFVPLARTSQAALEMLPTVESADSVSG
jgi:MFS family permease